MTTHEPGYGQGPRSKVLSRYLHSFSSITAGEKTGGAVGVTVAAWLIGYALAGFPTWMATTLQVAGAAATLIMVFVIHHTQRRVEVATQLKLDELVRSSEADDALAEIEADDQEFERRNARRASGGPH